MSASGSPGRPPSDVAAIVSQPCVANQVSVWYSCTNVWSCGCSLNVCAAGSWLSSEWMRCSESCGSCNMENNHAMRVSVRVCSKTSSLMSV